MQHKHWDQDHRLSRRGYGALLAARLVASCLAALAALAVFAGPAIAAAPTVVTGGAKSVSYSSATLSGTINPNGSSTSYYFQYGQTKAYGLQTGIASAGSGTKTASVRLTIGGLAPQTVYHYRLVAVNGSGVTNGHDHNFLTTKVPLSLAILASPNPSPFGGTVTVQGTLSGTNSANREVVLEELTFPFTGAWIRVPNINPQKTLSTGVFTFTVPNIGGGTQYRVVTATDPPVISAVTTENVAVRVVSHVAKTKRRGFVRFYGTVTPAEDGQEIGILRIEHGHGVLVHHGGTRLKHHSATSSTFSRVVRAHKGIYRVLARILNVPQSSNYGLPLRIR